MKMHKLHEEHLKLPQGEVILDTRSKEEFAEAHIDGAINIPHDEVQNHVEELKKYKKVHIHCRSGKRAQLAAQTLGDLGLDNLYCIDDSGIMHWIEAGYPTKKL